MSIEEGTIQSAPLCFNTHELTVSLGSPSEVLQKNHEIIDAFKEAVTHKYGSEFLGWVFSPDEEAKDASQDFKLERFTR